MADLTPREIVEQLDDYIIGQEEAKRSVAIALRNRWRRQQLEPLMREEVSPKNIIMIGPTGVGKTEIARRLANLANAPFLKVEASKFTEVGYVGKDVDSMVRDLTEIAVNMTKEEERKIVERKAHHQAEERLLDILLPPNKGAKKSASKNDEQVEALSEGASTRQKFRKMLLEGKLDEKIVDLETTETRMPSIEVFSNVGMEEMEFNLKEAFGNLFPKKTKKRKVKVGDAIQILTNAEAQKLIDMEKVVKTAIERVENSGIIFLDEIDKIAGRESGHGPDVSREGVQRDILPIIEGSTVTTKYGPVRTNHVLFIAAGAFHVSKPTDLIPELQGRFPIRVELKALNENDLTRILTEPKCSLTQQYIEMLKTEGVIVEFNKEAIEEISRIAVEVNSRMENIGARRLHTIMERLFDEVSFNAPEITGQRVVITKAYVEERLSALIKDHDLSSYIL